MARMLTVTIVTLAGPEPRKNVQRYRRKKRKSETIRLGIGIRRL